MLQLFEAAQSQAAQLQQPSEERIKKLSDFTQVLEEEKTILRERDCRYREEIASLKDDLFAAEQSIQDHPTTMALRAQNAELQERLEDLKKDITVLESKKAAPPRKEKTSGKSAPASDNLRKLFIADLNSDFRKNFEEQDRIAKLQAAELQQTSQDLENALVELDRLQKVVEEQRQTIKEQEQVVEERRELQREAPFWEDSGSPLSENQMISANELVEDLAAQSSATDENVQEESVFATSEYQLELPGETLDGTEAQYLA
ncbi:MAG: hypothetical protein Q9175_004259 [Cornicularia normoerica]